ncbi:MAG: PbsX family transcriptional regulator [Burkholderiales bacterium]|nr:PbsX family transcriptional regulator [Burkholderiales bacterium]
MESVIRKWGNSPALRLPSSVLKEAGYRLEQKVELVVRRGQIVIQPSRKLDYELNELLDGITPRNLHDESDFGAPAGKELL